MRGCASPENGGICERKKFPRTVPFHASVDSVWGGSIGMWPRRFLADVAPAGMEERKSLLDNSVCILYTVV